MKKSRKKFENPLKPWDKTRLEEERKISQDYGLRRKKEIWKMESILRNYRRIARNLAATANKENEKILLDKLFKMGLVNNGDDLDDVLALTTEKLLERRLQTLVLRKGLATTPKQARQFIVHGHISVDGRKIRWPSMIVPLAEENTISFYEKSKVKGVKIEKS
ncbi:MAG: 30S ribosomal protein S4 [Candidatus Aenigmatarchaeota archaeon]